MNPRTRTLARRILIAIVACYASWLAMLTVHELGHILGAWATGGRVISVSIPLLGFSQTIVHPNRRELLVVWCGPVFGTVIPLLLLLVCRGISRRVTDLIRFFAGFCAIANGAYIGLGWLRRAGDTGDLLRLGTPVAVMIAFGIVCVGIGLLCWHHTAVLTSDYWRAAR